MGRQLKGSCGTCQKVISIRSRYCSETCKETALASRRRSPEEQREASNRKVTEWRRRMKDKAVAYKGGACQGCGYTRSVRALTFHHLDPTKKDFGIGSSSNCKSWDTVKAELDKCVLLCSNCHAEVHDGLRSVGVGPA